MAILFETGKCISCNLRVGVQIACFFWFCINILALRSSIQKVGLAFTDEAYEWIKFQKLTVDCRTSLCVSQTDNSNCLSIAIDDGGAEGAPVKFMKAPESFYSPFQNETDSLKFDYSKWKLIKIEDLSEEDKQVFPEGGTGNDKGLQQVLQDFKEKTCKDAKKADSYSRLLLVTFDWKQDPTAQWGLTRLRCEAVGSLISTFIWFVIWLGLCYCVFGNEEGILDKAVHLNRLRKVLLGWMIIDFSVDFFYIVWTWGSFLHEIVCAFFIIGKSINFLTFCFIDNLNDVVQAGGNGTEGLPASQLLGKRPNENTPLAGDPVKSEDSA